MKQNCWDSFSATANVCKSTYFSGLEWLPTSRGVGKPISFTAPLFWNIVLFELPELFEGMSAAHNPCEVRCMLWSYFVIQFWHWFVFAGVKAVVLSSTLSAKWRRYHAPGVCVKNCRRSRNPSGGDWIWMKTLKSLATCLSCLIRTLEFQLPAQATSQLSQAEIFLQNNIWPSSSVNSSCQSGRKALLALKYQWLNCILHWSLAAGSHTIRGLLEML